MVIGKDIIFHQPMHYSSALVGETFLYDEDVFIKALIWTDEIDVKGQFVWKPIAISLSDGKQHHIDDHAVIEVLDLEIHATKVN